MQTKNNNGEWIIPIWEDRTFVEHVLTPSESWEKIEWLNQELKTCLRFQQIERKERRKYTSRLRLLGKGKNEKSLKKIASRKNFQYLFHELVSVDKKNENE